jgi:molybdopterin synthase catalytic subunit
MMSASTSPGPVATAAALSTAASDQPEAKFADIIRVTESSLQDVDVYDLVGSEKAGAISTFIGTTRDNFDGKIVTRLMYEAYVPMAEQEMRYVCLFGSSSSLLLPPPPLLLLLPSSPAHPCTYHLPKPSRLTCHVHSLHCISPTLSSPHRKLCVEIRSKWDVCNIAILHRLGVVSVRESSVVIAISSAHRRESLEAVAYAIDELKARVPIWKKEQYAEPDNAAQWKANSEFEPAKLLQQEQQHDSNTP